MVAITNSILLLTAAVAASASFVVPRDQPDGVYSVNEDGSHELIGSATTVEARDVEGFSLGSDDVTVAVRRGLGTRQSGCSIDSRNRDPICLASVKYCKDTNWNPAAVDGANKALAAQLDARVKATRDRPRVYSKNGGVVAYFCKLRGTEDMQGDSGSLKRALARISERCGQYHSGELNNDNGGPGAWAYGWAAESVKFC